MLGRRGSFQAEPSGRHVLSNCSHSVSSWLTLFCVLWGILPERPTSHLMYHLQGPFQSRGDARSLPHSLTASWGWKEIELEGFTFKCVLNVCALTLHWIFRKDCNFNSLESRWDLSWGGKTPETHPNVRESNSFPLVGQFPSQVFAPGSTQAGVHQNNKLYQIFVEQLSCAKCFTCV